LAALRGFEAAARLGSFSKAALELNMTQSAVSHQIKSLEESLGQPLFKRINRSVQLTDAGIDFQQAVAASLEVLAGGIKRLDVYKKPGSVVISCSVGFAGKWLVPRLPLLRKAHPEIEPWILPLAPAVDLDSAEVDLVISYGEASWPGAAVERMFGDAVTPLCSPGLIAGRAISLADVADYPLLHDERREDWRAWFDAAGMGEVNAISGPNFGDFGLSLDAAAAGQGIVLGNLVLAEGMIGDNKLIQFHDLCLQTAAVHRLVYNPIHLRRPAVEQFRQWLMAEAAISEVSLAVTVAG
jgi:LysR family glycine cleavage system transcriptional activator